MIFTPYQTRLINKDVTDNYFSTKTITGTYPCPCTMLYSESQNLTPLPRVPKLCTWPYVKKMLGFTTKELRDPLSEL